LSELDQARRHRQPQRVLLSGVSEIEDFVPIVQNVPAVSIVEETDDEFRK
jgi:hypothetical protein